MERNLTPPVEHVHCDVAIYVVDVPFDAEYALGKSVYFVLKLIDEVTADVLRFHFDECVIDYRGWGLNQ